MSAVQDFYPDDFSHCSGCGRLNRDGLHVRTIWQGNSTLARFTPRPQRKVTVDVAVTADGLLTARGTVIAVSLPDSMRPTAHAAR